MRSATVSPACLSAVLSGCLIAGCGSSTPSAPAITSVTPSTSGTPNSVVVFGNFEFASVQGTGQIFTYNLSSGSQALAVPAYATPCADPSGMVVASIAGNNVMAVACYDTGLLLTLTVNADGSLSPLGSVGGLPLPYPGIALDGTNLLVPLFGASSENGGVAKVSIASPSSPVIVGMASLASTAPGAFSNAVYLAADDGYIYVAAGSESTPLSSSSSIQVVDEATMTLTGAPLVVAHSPQQIAVQGGVAYVTFFDAMELESIDIASPASLQPLETVSLAPANQSCHAVPVAVENNFAYVGCYAEGVIDQINVGNPSQMQLAASVTGIPSPQRLAFAGNSLLVTDATTGGQVFDIDLAEF